MEDEKFDENKTQSNGKIFTLTRDISGDKRIDVDDLEWSYLEGDGDFRSEEVTRLRDEADLIITNPPFSLFRVFMAWIAEGQTKFSVIGNLNAITYKETFPLIQQNKLWIGASNFNVGMYFQVPDSWKYSDSYKFDRERDGKKVSRVPGVCWYTNIEHGKRHQPLPLMTMEENTKFSKHKEVRGVGYLKYDNFDAIEVPYTMTIPSDYEGCMGVPISFLEKYSPEQFEILGCSQNWDTSHTLRLKTYTPQQQVSADGRTIEVTKLNDAPALKVYEIPSGTYYEVLGDTYASTYKRLFIRFRRPAN